MRGPLSEDGGDHGLVVGGEAGELGRCEDHDVAGVAESSADGVLDPGPVVPALGSDHREVDIAVRSGLAPGRSTSLAVAPTGSCGCSQTLYRFCN